jgi:hypothetical protein
MGKEIPDWLRPATDAIKKEALQGQLDKNLKLAEARSWWLNKAVPWIPLNDKVLEFLSRWRRLEIDTTFSQVAKHIYGGNYERGIGCGERGNSMGSNGPEVKISTPTGHEGFNLFSNGLILTAKEMADSVTPDSLCGYEKGYPKSCLLEYLIRRGESGERPENFSFLGLAAHIKKYSKFTFRDSDNLDAEFQVRLDDAGLTLIDSHGKDNTIFAFPLDQISSSGELRRLINKFYTEKASFEAKKSS